MPRSLRSSRYRWRRAAAVGHIGLAAFGCASSHAALPIQPITALTSAAPLGAQPTQPPSISQYRVQRGDTVWRIAQVFGVESEALMAANRLRDPQSLRVGQTLVIPLPRESDRFLWPAKGQLNRHRRPVATVSGSGLEIRAIEGSYVRASRSGRVSVAATRLSTLGNTLILDHGDGFSTVYCGLDELFVGPGWQVRQGAPVGRLGRAPLYFEVRYLTRARDPLTVLP